MGYSIYDNTACADTYDLQTLPQCILGKGYFYLLKQCFLRKPELNFDREQFLCYVSKGTGWVGSEKW